MPSMCRPSPRLKADDSDVSANTAVNHEAGSILGAEVEGRGRGRERADVVGVPCGSFVRDTRFAKSVSRAIKGTVREEDVWQRAFARRWKAANERGKTRAQGKRTVERDRSPGEWWW
jgi:hypothetical protein